MSIEAKKATAQLDQSLTPNLGPCSLPSSYFYGSCPAPELGWWWGSRGPAGRVEAASLARTNREGHGRQTCE
eukprot:scaffold132142_cov19-Tisochrysis_lutea.AAC.1